MDISECIERTVVDGCQQVSPWHVRESLRMLQAEMQALKAANVQVSAPSSVTSTDVIADTQSDVDKAKGTMGRATEACINRLRSGDTSADTVAMAVRLLCGFSVELFMHRNAAKCANAASRSPKTKRTKNK